MNTLARIPSDDTLSALVHALQHRPIATILAEIGEAEKEADRYDQLCQRAEVGSFMERSFSNLFAEADERLSVLRTEARRAVESACGVTIAQIEAASL